MTTTTAPTRPHIVILGGGFAGLYTARGLRHADARVTLVDRHNHHLFQPMLYQVATAALSPGQIASPIRSVLRKQKNAEVVLAGATAIDAANRRVRLDDGSSLDYDYLVVATGARHSYFGHPEWEALAPGLKSIEDALEIRRRVLLAFERAEREPDRVKRQTELTFVVVGGGPTGVEMAGAVAEIRRFALKRDFRHINPNDATVVLLEGGPRLLATYPEKLSEDAKRELRELGVEVRTETMVTDIRPGSVVAGGWTIPTNTVIWAAGNAASPLLKSIGGELDRQGRAIVQPDLTVAGHPEIMVLGDAAFVPTTDGSVVPAVAPAAIQMGQYAGRSLINALKGRPRTPFKYWDKGQLAVIGRGQAVADIAKLRFHGFFAWLIWLFIHIAYLIGFRNRIMVLLEWGWAFVTYQRGARLITGSCEADLPPTRMEPATVEPAREQRVAQPV